MTRTDRLNWVLILIKGYKKQTGKDIGLMTALGHIEGHFGCSKKTAQDYLRTLSNGRIKHTETGIEVI